MEWERDGNASNGTAHNETVREVIGRDKPAPVGNTEDDITKYVMEHTREHGKSWGGISQPKTTRLYRHSRHNINEIIVSITYHCSYR